MKKLINEELEVYLCGLKDLTLEQTNHCLALWNDSSTIGSLTVFYDSEGRIILNADNKNFEKCKEIVIKYLQLSEDKKIELKEIITAETFKSIFKVLDAALKYRKIIAEQQAMNEKWKDIKRIVEKQPGPSIGTINEIREQFYDGVSIYWAVASIYNLGLIEGKRQERAKKKVSACKDFVQA